VDYWGEVVDLFGFFSPGFVSFFLRYIVHAKERYSLSFVVNRQRLSRYFRFRLNRLDQRPPPRFLYPRSSPPLS
jgi:hypothetical protein